MKFNQVTFFNLLMSLFLFSKTPYAQNVDRNVKKEKSRQFEIGLNSGYFITDNLTAKPNVINAVYHFTLETELRYYLSIHKRIRPFINTQFTTDLGTKGANLFTYNLGAGAKYPLINVKHRPIHLQGNMGVLFWQEKYSTELTDGIRETSFSEWGYRLNLGIAYQLTTLLSTQLYGSHFSTKETLVGLGFFYSF